jgi:phthiodiolone/phenolphthiodiolone dimycocerosates ketoreductase
MSCILDQVTTSALRHKATDRGGGTPMKIGMLLPAFPLDAAARARDTAHELGVDALWFGDHFLGFWHPEIWKDMPQSRRRPDPDAYPDPFCMCAALGSTTRLPLGMPVLRHLLDTGMMPDGGPGHIGLPLQSDVGPPRIWVAGQGPRALRLVGQYADGWMASRTMTIDPDGYAKRKAAVAEHAHAAGRTEPESAIGVFVLLGDSKQRVRQMLDDQPLAKLFALVMRPEYFHRYGREHPLGAEHRGAVDDIPHLLDPDRLRKIAPTIPSELVEGAIATGTVDDVVAEVRGFADAGCEQVMLINTTGLVGGDAEVQAHTPKFAELCQRVRQIRVQSHPVGPDIR